MIESLGQFARGTLLGFSIAAPVGPIGVLCIRRTLAEGRATGLATGLGAAVADGLYGAAAAFGLTWLTEALVGHATWIRLAGGLFLLYLGIATFLAKPASEAAQAGGAGLAGAFGSTFVLTLTNPMTMLSFVAVFAGLGLGAAGAGAGAAAVLVAGVVVGSAAWWLLLSAGVDRLRHRFDANAMGWVNRISGVVIMAFAAWSLMGAMGGRS